MHWQIAAILTAYPTKTEYLKKYSWSTFPGYCYLSKRDQNMEIGAIFGVDYSTVSQSRARLKTKLKSSRKLNKQFHQILGRIDNL